MATIIPFHGLRYNIEKISNLASVVTPPYDIIDETAQTKYYSEHPSNIIRLELGLSFPNDNAEKNRYTRARQYLEKWLEDETLIIDADPSLYIYQQSFVIQGQQYVRSGFICGLKVEEYKGGNVLPHEETLSKPKADRLQLMRATQANFSSIFGLYSDKEKTIDNIITNYISENTPEIEIVDEANEQHRIWVLSDSELISSITKIIADKKIYIADGHHRYETALEYARLMKEEGKPGFDYVLTTLVNIYDEGLVVLPTHRIVGNISGFKLNAFLKRLEEQFEVTKVSGKSITEFTDLLREKGKTDHTFGLYSGKIMYMLKLRSEAEALALLPSDKSKDWKALDVAILDYLILDQMLNIGENERRNQDNLAYTQDENKVVEMIDKKQYQLGFVLNPTKVEEILAVANAQEKMPQKSTYFYPKLITGLIINNFK